MRTDGIQGTTTQLLAPLTLSLHQPGMDLILRWTAQVNGRPQVFEQFNINLRLLANQDASQEVPVCVACITNNPRVQLRYRSDDLHIVQFKFEHSKQAHDFVQAVNDVCPIYYDQPTTKADKSHYTDPIDNYVYTEFGLSPLELRQEILNIMTEPSFELLVQAIERQLDGTADWPRGSQTLKVNENR